MNKQHLVDIIRNPTVASLRDLENLEELTELYPYFQIAHTLVAKCHHDRQTVMAQQYLNTAAIFSINRNVLKDYINTSFITTQADFLSDETSVITPEKAEEIVQENPELQEHTFTEEIDQQQAEQTELKNKNDKLYEEIEDNIRKLQSVKEKLNLFGDTDPSKKQEATHQEVSSEKESIEDQQDEDKNLETLEYIEEIAKRESKDISEVQKEQQQIIDSFISNAPKIHRAQRLQTGGEYQEDLTKKFSQINNDLLTENLASIMAKQGKTDKAIDIYEKLIWKYPEKKAYFASCIENLKNQ